MSDENTKVWTEVREGLGYFFRISCYVTFGILAVAWIVYSIISIWI